MAWSRPQRDAVAELRALHAAHPDKVVHVGTPYRSDATTGTVLVDVELSTDTIDTPTGDRLLHDTESVTVAVASTYPEHPPRVFVDHDRFVDVAHVLFGREFCIYLDPDRQWHPSGGVTDALNQTWRLLEDAANSRFDPLTALFHPVGGFNPATKGTGTAVVRSFPGTEGKPLSVGEAAARTPVRIDFGATGSFPDRTTKRSVTVTVPGRLRHGPGWHQPIGEAVPQSRLGTTLLREFEEELLGREDLEQMSEESKRVVDPLHQERRQPALAALLDNPGSLHVRLTGFGLNLLSGTYEAPCLIAVDDENWWGEWGHEIAGNWETTSIDCYSSADDDGLMALVHDSRWSNEGLFSLVEGLRCLNKIDRSGRVGPFRSTASP